ncbi:MAG: LUD domain-containing protein [Deltaproteobacteria bacterium]|nr:LUD domain-containing protein [Deltaproteobacteria bacterium]
MTTAHLRLISKFLFGGESRLKGSSKRSLEAAFSSVIKRQEENSSRLPDLFAMKARLKSDRESSLGNERLFERAIENLEKNRFKVVLADSMDEAFEAVLSAVGEERLVVKSKSNITKEMRLAHKLSERGIETIETDIGDRVLQLSGERPSHPTGPVSHLGREAISGIISASHGYEVPADPEVIVGFLKSELKDAIGRARVGITGANAIAASEGSVVIIHNEGNVAEISRLEKHIIVTDSNKIYEDLHSALNMVKLQTYYATGSVTTAYINILSGPSRTADIEKKLFYGVHGPVETIVVIVKRPSAVDRLRESQYCIGCGGCLLECPAYLEKGPAFGSAYKQGGIGVIDSAVKEGVGAAYENGLYSCLKCGLCKSNCPVSIDTPGMIGRLKEEAVKYEPLKKKLKPLKLVANSVTFAANAKGALAARAAKGKKTAYFPGCVTTINTPEIREAAIKVIEYARGERPSVIEGCCGGAYDSFGFSDEREKGFDDFLKSAGESGAEEIIVSCPHCYEMLDERRGRLEGRGVKRVLRLTEAVGGAEFVADHGVKAAYHDSCVFGRKYGAYDEPREILKKAGAAMVEMERAREKARCCGFPLILREPEAALPIAQKVADSAISSGAEKLITSACPGCYYAMKRTSGIDVEDISVYLSKKIMKRKASV